MRKRPTDFDTELAKKQWDYAAEAFAQLQASGNDYYRTGYFGPAHIDMCGSVSGLDVLDIGCGAGYFSRELSKLGAVVTAIDLSAEMIEIAQRQSTDNDIRYQVLDAANIAGSFAPESFDLVTACVSLQDMPDPPAVIQCVYKSSSPRPKEGYVCDEVLYVGGFNEINIHLLPKVRRIRIWLTADHIDLLRSTSLHFDRAKEALIITEETNRISVESFSPTVFTFNEEGFEYIPSNEYIARSPKTAVHKETITMSEAIARWNIELVYVDDLDAVISELRSLNIPFSEQT